MESLKCFKWYLIVGLLAMVLSSTQTGALAAAAPATLRMTTSTQGPIIIDHATTDVTQIPQSWIEEAKATLHIGYGHTSHGSQLTSGMSGLVSFANGGGLGLSLPDDIFQYSANGNQGGAVLHLFEGDGYGSGDLDHDAGYYPNWVDETRAYLGTPDPDTGRGQNHPEMNVILWSWCGQASGYTEQQMLDRYLTPMSELEADYPGVTFVYMTGHADGTGESGNLHQRNQQIRQYCIDHNKVLYDFYDLELYDPDGNYYGNKAVTDNCDYDSDGNGSRDRNWAIDWQNTHAQNADWYSCSCAHSQPLNCNQKAYAAWWLWARLAGWPGPDAQAALTLTAPTGGERWPTGTKQQIRWTTTGNVPEFSLTTSTDGFTTTHVIAAPVANPSATGVYTWTTPVTPTHTAQVRIASTTQPAISDTSGTFTLYDPDLLTPRIYLPLILRSMMGSGSGNRVPVPY